MLDWQDGQPFSKRYGDVYFSADSGLEETRHVFLQGNHLAERFAALSAGESFCIGETGFGTGLNFLCAWQLFERVAPPGASLDYFSVEKFPLSDDELRAALALWPELAAQAGILIARWHRRVPGWNRWSFAGGRVRLTLAMEDVEQALPQLPACCVDAWFLDGFSPAKNPEMWSDAVLAGIARASRDGATLATYTCAGWVRRGLQQAGFDVERAEGFGRKREMVRGYLSSVRTGRLAQQGVSKHERKTPDTAIVIGGGIAGCAAAHALAQRGIHVTLIERASQLATAGSGNPRGILHARFGAGMNALHRFVLAAYGHALALLDEAVPTDRALRSECGLLQLAATEAEAKRIGKLSVQEWPAHLLQVVDAAKASELVGMEMAHGGLWFPAGGWVVPPQVCARLADHPLIAQRLGCEVTALERTASGWRASGEGFAVEAEQVVVCSGHQAKNLSQFAAFPLQAVRGQISILPATAASESLHAVLCAEGYCAPAVEGLHVVGATSTFDDAATDLREADHCDNLVKIAAHMPVLHQALGDAKPLAGRAGVRCSVPGATPLVGEVAPPTRYWQSQPVAGGGAEQSLPHQRTPSHRVATAPGLYCSLAHGTRGLLTAGIAGEVIAAAMCGQLPPLPQSLLDALAPLPRVRNKGKCAA
ncbi:MAG: bifunctional tRNA (5-methylaminomethyl-2-thiouridine)(34)-methyltransferase MnmD/FAD-dependent 5-carboxymethylaminomethyl-2-thiouridine(34) oxidoreductase MnmC [Sideroxyarcus sp.]|nr:bifunctional tRNA (5-methylaminomethyl-2-thiouridine)(34)-methyltransferase MnmD/FAD-dependent 5-carboxymethylaminomethyl-2-thiouridine(34) oxidoreductase MnmC [Sideroxyarcus sp.]